MVRALAGWWLPHLPRQRVAWVRAVVAAMAVLDVLVLLTSPRNRVGTPQFFDPVPLARALQLPAPTPALATSLTLVVLLGAAAVVVGGGRAVPAWVQHVGGPALAVGYGLWAVYAMSFGYVAHDHMALVVAVCVLPTAGTCRYTGPLQRDPGAGWALRMVQVFTVATYTGSVLAKWVLTDGNLLRWANSGTLVWAFLRRPNPVNVHLVEQASLLRLSQWGALVLELAAPVVFLLRERWRLLAIAAFAAFHAATFVLLGIHFLPTLVCWTAFLPLERLPTWWDRRRRGPAAVRRAAAAEATTAPAAGSA